MLNEYLTSQRDVNKQSVIDDYDFPLAKRIVCVDGFNLSVQATHGAYCFPRKNIGPWFKVEVGYASELEEEFMPYAESPDTPTETVYGYVPVEVVERVIAKHGGMKPPAPTKQGGNKP